MSRVKGVSSRNSQNDLNSSSVISRSARYPDFSSRCFADIHLTSIHLHLETLILFIPPSALTSTIVGQDGQLCPRCQPFLMQLQHECFFILHNLCDTENSYYYTNVYR